MRRNAGDINIINYNGPMIITSLLLEEGNNNNNNIHKHFPSIKHKINNNVRSSKINWKKSKIR